MDFATRVAKTTTRQQIRHLLHDIGLKATNTLLDMIEEDVLASGRPFSQWEHKDFQQALRWHESELVNMNVRKW